MTGDQAAAHQVNSKLTRRIGCSLTGTPASERSLMLPEHRILLEDEPCPVSDETLGEMYRASAHWLT